ncbi:hypothetical protein Droror1_Dr00009315 [Drosera rotundifolia]
MAIHALRTCGYGLLPFSHHHTLKSSAKISSRTWKLKNPSKRLIVSAQYSQAQDFLTSRLQDRLQILPTLVEDIIRTSISTGPRGAVRLVQGIQAVVGVGGEWLQDVSK